MMLGKRKRRASLDKESSTTEGHSPSRDYHALLRQHFESAYEPLVTENADEETNDSAASEEWDGLSSGDEQNDVLEDTDLPVVEIIDHSGSLQPDNHADSRKVRKAFMSSKLPSESTIQALRKVKPAKQDEDPTSEAALVKNDLALQRLLRESKLLSSASSAGTNESLQLSGKQRHKALDTHLQALGAKSSIQTQKSMPRAHRVGIAKKAMQKEGTRRAEAREAGIVLEKVKRVSSDAKRRDRGVGGPGVGKFRGGTLSLSAKDVRAIQGPSVRAQGKKKGRR